MQKSDDADVEVNVLICWADMLGMNMKVCFGVPLKDVSL